MILAIKTDKPESELLLIKEGQSIDKVSWEAGRQLSNTLLIKITDLLTANKSQLNDLQAIIVFKGPGTFTGLRIGHSVANALAYSLDVPIVSETGEDWISIGVKRLANGENEKQALPEYGAEANITTPRK